MTTPSPLLRAKYEARAQSGSPHSVSVPLVWVRMALKLSLAEFAELLPLRGGERKWTAACLSLVENGKRRPSPELVSAINSLVAQHTKKAA